MYGNELVLSHGDEKLYKGVKLILSQGYTYYVEGFQKIITLKMFTFSLITSLSNGDKTFLWRMVVCLPTNPSHYAKTDLNKKSGAMH